MKVVFLSNYYNHHQAPFSEAMQKLLGDSYVFIETEPMEAERLAMGWGVASYPSFVWQYYKTEMQAVCTQLIYEADIVIVGCAPEILLKRRLQSGKLTLWYSERIFKKKARLLAWPLRWVRYFLRNGRYKNSYLLCAGAYVYADYAKCLTFWNRAFRWGYFPETRQYQSISIIESKKPGSLLWAGRMIDWKHGERAVKLAAELRDRNIDFTLHMIGDGDCRSDLENLTEQLQLEDYVQFLGSMKPEQVRKHMEQSEIFVFTSDRQEGWGAVLNESMNSGCAVVASHAIGAVPYLLRQDENGMLFQDESQESLVSAVVDLIQNPEKRCRLAQNAMKTIENLWNAEEAAKRLMVLGECLLNENGRNRTKKAMRLFADDGPLSRAEFRSDHWM